MNLASLASLAGKLSPSHQVFAGLHRVLADPNSGIDEVVAIIRVDPAMTASLIRAGNSVVFGWTEPARTLEAAINRLGFREVHRLVGAIASRRLQERMMTVYPMPPEAFWRFSAASALAAEALAKNLGEDSRHAYALGLLHGLGQYSIDLLLAESGKSFSAPPSGDLGRQAAWERRTVGFDHAEASAFLLEEWGLPTEVVTPVRWYLKPLDAPEFVPQACLLHLAVAIGRSRIDPERRPPKWPVAVLEGVALGADEVSGIIPEVVNGLNRVAETIGLRPGAPCGG